MQIFIYSKDRPFQLQQLLASLERFVLQQEKPEASQVIEGISLLKFPLYFNVQVHCSIAVFYTYTNERFQKLYESVKAQYLYVNFVLEDKTLEQLQKTIEYTPFHKEEGPTNTVNFFSFMVDDMLFFREVDLPEILFRLYSDDQLYTVHLKLYPGINYSHTTDKIMTLPRLTVIDQITMKYLKYKRTEGELDWNYPFDFCGSIYRLQSVLEVMQAIEEKAKMLKPNSFEYIGNVAIKRKMLGKDQLHCMCLNVPVMTVITVNKVQDIYDTPVYTFKGDQQNQQEESKGEESKDEEENVLEIMNGYLEQGQAYYIDDFYSKQMFNSVHIGDFRLKLVHKEQIKEENKPHVAVIMPVYNDYEFLEEAIKSVLGQTYTSHLTLIILNDGSTEPQVAKILEQYQQCKDKILIQTFEKNMGLAYSLNYGIKVAMDLDKEVQYIARMDADDVCIPQRIEMQVNYLQINSYIDVVGTSVQLFGERRDHRVITYHAQDELIRYNMLYFCSIAHPSIMFRATSLKEHKFNYGMGKMEDYRLWLSMYFENNFKFGNIGTVLLKLRKHEHNQSSQHTIDDEAEIKQPLLVKLLTSINDNENLAKLIEKIQSNIEITKEFITITGKEIKSQEVFKKLQHRQVLVQIFDSLIKYYNSSKQEKGKIYKDYILKNLNDRKGELALYAVANDLDTEMLKCLLQGGQLKRLMGK